MHLLCAEVNSPTLMRAIYETYRERSGKKTSLVSGVGATEALIIHPVVATHGSCAQAIPVVTLSLLVRTFILDLGRAGERRCLVPVLVTQSAGFVMDAPSART